ncbi:MAG: hypoxanthine phosphoribosyltransferase [Candidatus Kapaibacteriales bacterium]
MLVKYNKQRITIDGRTFKHLISKKEIDRRINELAKQIKQDYQGLEPVFLIVLNGAIFFAVDLLKKLDIPLRIDTIIAKSYGNSIKSSGKVELSLKANFIKGKDIIIIEDIVDTGLTISTIVNEVYKYEPKSLEIASLLLKPENLKCEINIKYCGFEIPKDFVVGYGLDFAEFGRNLKSLYILEKEE